MDNRKVWLVTESGVPSHLVWGLHKNPSSVAEQDKKSWSCALTEEQEADPAFDATPTAWRRAPSLMQHALGSSSLVGRILRIGGVEYDLDDTGLAIAGQENEACRGTLVSQSELQALVDAVGSALTYHSKSTGDHVACEPTP